MKFISSVAQFRQLRHQAHGLSQGESAPESIPGQNERMAGGLATFVLAFGVTFVVILIRHWSEHRFFGGKLMLAGDLGFQGGLIGLGLYLLLPVGVFLLYLGRHGRWPPKSLFRFFSWPQKGFSVLALAGLVVGTTHHGQLHHWWQDTWRSHLSTAEDAKEWHLFRSLSAQTAVVFVGLLLLLRWALPAHARRRAPRIQTQPKLSLWLGVSTGILLARRHQAALTAQQHVTLGLDDACKNLIVLGGIGEGKTTRVMHPVLLQLLDQDCGGLIFDIKGDFHGAVMALAEQTKRTITRLGPEQTPMNLLTGLSPELAASFLKSACLLQGHSLDNFWIETATELCRNSLGVLSFLPEYYSLHGLYRYLFEPEFKDTVLSQTDALRVTLDADASRLLDTYTRYEHAIYEPFDEKVKSGVQATIAQILSPFNHPALIDAFCTAAPTPITFPAVLDGAVFLVDLPLARWGLGAKVAYTLIKLRLFNVLQQRTTQPDWNQDRPVFFLCDEYQEIVSCNKDGLSDLNFWDKARSSKTIGVISAQSIASFYAAIGHRDVANALLQNFRQKLCLKTDDQTTLDALNRLTGHVETGRRSYASQSGHTSVPDKWSKSHHRSTNESLSFQDKPVIDAQLVRALGPNQAIALLSVGGYSLDDVLELKPVFV